MINAYDFVHKHYRGDNATDPNGLASLSIPRSISIINLLSKTINVDGDVAECGVWKGGTAYLIAKFLQENCAHKRLYLYDTFNGMPVVGPNDTHLIGDFSDTSISSVANLLDFNPNVIIQPGIFPDSFMAADRVFSFVHADMDQEHSTRSIIDRFSPLMANGSIMAFDDYYNDRCMGVKIAVDEVFWSKQIDEIQYVEFIKADGSNHSHNKRCGESCAL